MMLRRLFWMAIALTLVWLAISLAENRFGSDAQRRDRVGLLEDFFLSAVLSLSGGVALFVAFRRRREGEEEEPQDREQML